MKTALKTITNVEIAGSTVTSGGITGFRANGEVSWMGLKWTNMSGSGSLSSAVPADNMYSVWTNGDRGTFTYAFSPGTDYMCRPTVYRNEKLSDGYVGNGIFDVYLGAGRFQQDTEAPGSIFIDRDITSILPPVRYDHNGSSIVKGGCRLVTDSGSALIESYDSDTGECVVSGSSLGMPEKGVRYKLMSNYLMCEPFVYCCRSPHTVALSAQAEKYRPSESEGGLRITGEYSQSQGVGLQCYELSMSYSYGGTEKAIAAPRRYSGRVSQNFPTFNSAEIMAKCLAVTQEGSAAEFSLDVAHGTPSEDLEVKLWYGDSGGNAVNIYCDFDISSASDVILSLWRADLDDNGDHKHLRFVGSTNAFGTEDGLSYFTVTDRTAGCRRRYVYIASLTVGTEEHSGVSEPVEFSARQYYITKLEDYGEGCGYRRYRKGDISYTFSCGIDGGSIATSTGSAVYSSEAEKPKLIAGSDCFDSGTFTAILGSIESLEQTYPQLEQWQDFISSPGLFLLKTDMGDVKIVGITDPTRIYGSELAQIGVTKVTYGWTEAEDIEGVVIV